MENSIFCGCESVEELVNFYQSTGQLEEAEDLVSLLVKKTESIHSIDDPVVLKAKTRLVSVLKLKGKLAEAEAISREILRQRIAVNGPNHVDTIKSICNLSVILNSAGKIVEAEKFGRQALDVSAKVLGNSNPVTLSCLSNLAILLNSQRKSNEAESIFRLCLFKYNKVLGAEHAMTILAKFNLATFLMHDNKSTSHKESERLFREVLFHRRATLGAEDKSTLVAASNLVNVLRLQQRLKEAEAVCAEYKPVKTATTKPQTDIEANASPNVDTSCCSESGGQWGESIGGAVPRDVLQQILLFLEQHNLKTLSTRDFVFQLIQPFNMIHNCSCFEFLCGGGLRSPQNQMGSPVRRRKLTRLALEFSAFVEALPAYVQLVEINGQQAQDEQQPSEYMYACHAWDCMFYDVVNQLLSSMNDSATQYVWLDVLMVNQRSLNHTDFGISHLLVALKPVLEKSKSVALIIPDAVLSLPLVRSWCLYELFQAISNNIPLNIVMSCGCQRGTESWRQEIQEFTKQVFNINADNSDCDSKTEKQTLLESMGPDATIFLKNALMAAAASELLKTQASRSDRLEIQEEVRACYSIKDESDSGCRPLEVSVERVLAENEEFLHEGAFTEAKERLFQAVSTQERRILQQNDNIREDDLILLHSALGRVNREGGELQQAEVEFRRALELSESIHGADHATTFECAGNLGNVVIAMGNSDDALKLSRQAWAGFTSCYGPQDSRTIQAQFNLSIILDSVGLHSESSSLCKGVVNWRQDRLGATHPSTLNAILALANTLRRLRQFQRAEDLYERVLAVREKIFGHEHPEVHNVLVRMAQCKSEAGHAALAMTLYNRAHATATSPQMQQQMYSPPSSSSSKGNRGRGLMEADVATLSVGEDAVHSLMAVGRFQEAEDLCRKLVASFSNTDNPFTLRCRHQLSVILESHHNLSEAAHHMQVVVSGRSRVLGDTHPDTIDSKYHFANQLRGLDRLEESEVLYREVLQHRRQKLGDRDTVTLTTMNGLGIVLMGRKKYDESEQLLRLVLEGRLEVFDKHDEHVIHSMLSLAECLRLGGKFEDSLALYRQCLEELIHKHGSMEHPECVRCATRVDDLKALSAGEEEIRALMMEKRCDEAEKLCRRMNSALVGVESVFSIRCRHQLAVILEANHKLEEAFEIMQQVVGVRIRLLGDIDAATMDSKNHLATILRGLGRLQEAEILYREVLQHRTARYGQHDDLTLNSKSNVGKLLLQRGDYCQAEIILRQVLEGRQQLSTGDPNEDHVVHSQINLAECLWLLGKLDECITLFQQAHDKMMKLKKSPDDSECTKCATTVEKVTTFARHENVVRRQFAEGNLKAAEDSCRKLISSLPDKINDCPLLLRCHHQLALILEAGRRFEEAAKEMEAVVAGRQRCLGQTHADTMDSVNHLATQLRGLERLEEAQVLYQQVLEFRRATLGDRHLLTMTSLNNVGILLLQREKYSDAEQSLREVLKGRVELAKGATVDDHIIHSKLNLAECMRLQCRYDESAALFQEALDDMIQLHGPDHSECIKCAAKIESMPTLSVGSNSVQALFKKGKLQEAEEICKKLVASLEDSQETVHSLCCKHLLAVVLEAAHKLEEAVKVMQPVVDARARILGENDADTLDSKNHLANQLRGLKRFQEAEALYRELQQFSLTVNGENHNSTLNAMTNVGTVLIQQGKFVEAEQVLRKVLSQRMEMHTGNDSNVIHSRLNLAECLWLQGNLKESQELYQQSLTDLQSKHDTNYPECVKCSKRINSLSKWASEEERVGELLSQGQLEDAEACSRSLVESLPSVESPYVLRCRHQMAVILEDNHKVAEAAEVMASVVAGRKHLLGDMQEDTIDSTNFLAGQFRKLERYEEAEQLYRDVLKFRTLEAGDDDPRTLTALNDVGLVLVQQKKYAEAEMVLGLVLEARTKLSHSPTDEQIIRSKMNLAECLRLEGKFDESTTLFQQALDELVQKHGSENPECVQCEEKLSNMQTLEVGKDSVHALFEQGCLEEAEERCRKLVAALDEISNDNSSEYSLRCKHQFGVILEMNHKGEEAVPYLAQVVSGRERVLGCLHPDTINSKNHLANLLRGLKRYEEAEQLFQDVLKFRALRYGDDDELTLNAMNSVATVLIQRGKVDEAEQVLQKLLEKRKLPPQSGSRDDEKLVRTMLHLAECLYLQDKLKQSQEMYQQSMDELQLKHDSDHPECVNCAAMIESLSKWSQQEANVGGLVAKGRLENAEVACRNLVASLPPVENRHVLRCIHQLGVILEVNRKVAEAAEVMKAVVDGRQRLLGDTHKDTIDSKNHLATQYRKLERLEEAEELYQEVLTFRVAEHGNDDSRTLTAQNNVGILLLQRKQLDDAEKLLRQVLEGRLRVSGPSDDHVIHSTLNLAECLRLKCLFDESAALFQQALEELLKNHGPDYPECIKCKEKLSSMQTLSVGTESVHALFERGNFQEAEEKCQKLIAALEGIDHGTTVNSGLLYFLKCKHQLGVILEVNHKFEEAATLMQHVVTMRQQLLGSHHPDTIDSKNHLANHFRELSRLEEAEMLYREVLEFRTLKYGKNFLTLNSMNNLGKLLMQRGAYVEAEKLLREVLADRKEICSPDDDHVVQSIFTLAECLRLECKYDDSVALLEQGLDILNVKHGPSHPVQAKLQQRRFQDAEDMCTSMVASFPVASTGADGSSSSDTEYTLQCRHQLSVLLEAHRKFPDAAVHMQQVVAGRQRLLGELHSDTIDSKYHLGSQYRALKKLDKAEQLFAEVLKSRRAAFGEMDLQTLTAMNNLAILHIQCKKFEKAEPLLREVLAKRIELCGRNDDDSVIHSMLLLAECLHVVGKIGESVELLQAGLEELITKNGPEHPECVKYTAKLKLWEHIA